MTAADFNSTINASDNECSKLASASPPVSKFLHVRMGGIDFLPYALDTSSSSLSDEFQFNFEQHYERCINNTKGYFE